MRHQSVLQTIALLLISASAPVLASAQSPTDPPPSQHAILTLTGKGVQIYVCQQPNASAAPDWVFEGPEATLTDTTGKVAATHAAGPIWIAKDGSSVKGKVLQTADATDLAAIPWLLLKATPTSGTGTFSTVEFIRRSDTHGGLAPNSGCDAENLDRTVRVPYTATYTFYTSHP
jgi:hypothetical protein